MNKLTTGLLALGLAACGGSSSTPPDANPPAPDANPGPPAPPTLGAQMDRMGRPAINTALNHTFDPDNVSKQAAKDAYNNNATPSTWKSAFQSDFEATLGILDGIDGTCGNQLAYDSANHSYAPLAGLLTDDQLYVNSGSGTCTTYLAVEAHAVLGLPTGGDCGGRVMSYDVIKTSYSVLVNGSLSDIDDGIANEAVPADPASFPFLAAPL